VTVNGEGAQGQTCPACGNTPWVWTTTCDNCGMIETNPKAWVEAALGGEGWDFCSWECASAFFAKMVAKEGKCWNDPLPH
jgi:hypothetical protein